MLKLVLDKQDLITCLPLTAMIVLATVRLLALSGIEFFPTIYRTTSEHAFNISLTNSFLIDGLIILLAGLFVINVTVDKKFRILSAVASSVFAYASIMYTLYVNKSALDIAGIS